MQSMALDSATKFSFKPGDVIVNCSALVWSVNYTNKGKNCDYCLSSSDDLKKCSECKCFYYCHRKCQTRDWKVGHQYECKIFSKAVEEQPDLLKRDCDRLLLRLHLKIKNDPQVFVKRFKAHDGQHRTLESLMDHLEDITGDEVRMGYFTRTKEIFQNLDVKYNEERLFSLFGKICINSFTIEDRNARSPASGLFLEASTMDHSCVPNASVVFDNNTVHGPVCQVRCISQINEGEKVTVNYVDIKIPTFDRQMRLSQQYYFNCTCERCLQKNNHELDAIAVEIKNLDEEFDEIVTSGSPSKDWKKAYHISLKSLPLYEKVYGSYHPDLTLQLMRIVKTRMMLEDGDTVEFDPNLHALVKKLGASIKVTHGEKHSLFNSFQNLFESQ